MKINLVSKSLENYLLNKFDVDNVENIDLNKVVEISLNAVGENGNLEDYDFKDLKKLKNLKYISLQNFTINNYETNEINRCTNVEAIQFSNCKIKSKSRIQNSIKVISFDRCKGFRIYYISLLKNLQVLKLTNLRLVNLINIENLKKLEKIYFENIIIFNFHKLLNLKSLIYIRIIKCKWNKKIAKKLEHVKIEK